MWHTHASPKNPWSHDFGAQKNHHGAGLNIRLLGLHQILSHFFWTHLGRPLHWSNVNITLLSSQPTKWEVPRITKVCAGENLCLESRAQAGPVAMKWNDQRCAWTHCVMVAWCLQNFEHFGLNLQLLSVSPVLCMELFKFMTIVYQCNYIQHNRYMHIQQT